MHLLATIVEGEEDWADLLFLIAFLLFTVVTFMHAVARSVEAALLSAGLALTALALFLL